MLQSCPITQLRKAATALEKATQNRKKQSTPDAAKLETKAKQQLARAVTNAAGMIKDAAKSLVVCRLDKADVAYCTLRDQMVAFCAFAPKNPELADRTLNKALNSNHLGLDSLLLTDLTFPSDEISDSKTIKTLRLNAENGSRGRGGSHSMKDLVALAMNI